MINLDNSKFISYADFLKNQHNLCFDGKSKFSE